MKGIMNGSRNVFIICATVMFCFVLGAALAVIRLSTDSQALGVITLLFTNLSIVIAALATYLKAGSNSTQLDSIEGHTDRLINGDMEAKIESVIRRIITNENLKRPGDTHVETEG